jgi:predicted aldo/keto reductase-like oxidoreductase
MQSKRKGCCRRQFLKASGACALGALIAAPAKSAPAAGVPATAQDHPIQVPTRAFGKSGMKVSILAMGGMFDIAANQLMLKQAIQWGVTYWDTADCYQSGSEAGIGKYFAKYPQDRSKIFLVTKSDARDPDGISRLLQRSLQRLNTDHIDLYFMHGVRSIRELDDDTRRWAEKAKAEKKIRLFGFSTHSNMADCLSEAARLGWIDGIMLSYNYRLMHSEKMKDAVAACAQAGIGLTAMKTQGGSSWFGGQSDELKQLAAAKGLTEEQAKLKAVWQNPKIASICSQMDSMKLLKANAAAASDPTPLTSEEMRLLKRHALATADQYCAGCHAVCQAAVGGRVPVADVMRDHMYCRSYGRSDWARAHFETLSAETRRQMALADYTQAERRCPQKMPIARLMREALEDFG